MMRSSLTEPRLDDAVIAALLEDVLMPCDLGTEQPGDFIGPYQLIEQIGEGGFGIVWRAQQSLPVERQVALKLIKLGMDSSSEVIRRFELEYHVLARMAHPHITAILDAGHTDDERPYFIMELVKGSPITRYCAEREMPLGQRISLFKAVCMGVQHAHQKGIIHCDLKPSNILITEVDGQPVPKIIDFGIAKAIIAQQAARISSTKSVERTMGTLPYMSPEQFANLEEMDTRSDIYSLGAVLYELLAGQPPFDTESLRSLSREEMQRMMNDIVPQRPSHCRLRIADREGEKNSAVSGIAQLTIGHQKSAISKDLDSIALCALQKEPRHRYASAAEFAADLQRYLNNEPVTVHPPSVSYITAQWMRRHRAAFIAASISAIAIFAGSGIAIWQAIVARREQRIAEQQSARATLAEATAQGETHRAQQTAAFLEQLLDNAAEEAHQGSNPEVLKLALDRSEKLLLEMENEPSLQLSLIARLVGLYSTIGEWKTAIRLQHRHASLLATQQGPDSPDARASLLAYLHLEADHGARITVPAQLTAFKAYLDQHGEHGSKIWFEVQADLIRVWLKLDSPNDALPLSQESLAKADQQKFKGLALLKLQLIHASILEAAKKFAEAETLLNDCRLHAQKQSKSVERLELIELRLLSLLQAKGDHTRRAQLLRDRLARATASLGANSRDLIPQLISLSLCETTARHHEEAILHAQQALAIARQPSATPEKNKDNNRPDIGLALRTLAKAESSANRHDDALAHAAEARTIAEAQGNSTTLAIALECQALAQLKAHHPDEAYRCYAECHQLRIKVSSSYRTCAENLVEMAQIRLDQNRAEEALDLARQMWTLITTNPDAAQDLGFCGYIAQWGVKAWDMQHQAHPDLPPPTELATWQRAQKLGQQVEAKQEMQR